MPPTPAPTLSLFLVLPAIPASTLGWDYRPRISQSEPGIFLASGIGSGVGGDWTRPKVDFGWMVLGLCSRSLTMKPPKRWRKMGKLFEHLDQAVPEVLPGTWLPSCVISGKSSPLSLRFCLCLSDWEGNGEERAQS